MPKFKSQQPSFLGKENLPPTFLLKRFLALPKNKAFPPIFGIGLPNNTRESNWKKKN